jgi:glucokinase
MNQLIGVDLGGSALKLGRFSLAGELLAGLEVPTPQPSLPGAVTTAIVEAVQQLDPEHLADRVGVGHPGPSDGAGRVARIAINLPGWREVPLADWLEPLLDRRVTLANDANCALLGEHWLGAARDRRDVVLLTLGTGVGGAVLLDGLLFTGRHGAAAEPGLIGIDPQGPPCNSGNSGSIESYCSRRGLARLSGLDPAELRRLYLFTPELVLIGGGISAASAHFLPGLWGEVEQRVQPVSREGLAIRPCSLGNGAGRLGAARLALERLASSLG